VMGGRLGVCKVAGGSDWQWLAAADRSGGGKSCTWNGWAHLPLGKRLGEGAGEHQRWRTGKNDTRGDLIRWRQPLWGLWNDRQSGRMDKDRVSRVSLCPY